MPHFSQLLLQCTIFGKIKPVFITQVVRLLASGIQHNSSWNLNNNHVQALFVPQNKQNLG